MMKLLARPLFSILPPSHIGLTFWAKPFSLRRCRNAHTRIMEPLVWTLKNKNEKIYIIISQLCLSVCVSNSCTVELRWSGIMAKIFGVFGTKTCSFIKENRTKNGPLVFRTVLCSKHDEKLGNCQRKTLRQVVGCGIVRF